MRLSHLLTLGFLLLGASACATFNDMKQPHCETREGRTYTDEKGGVESEAACSKIGGRWVAAH